MAGKLKVIYNNNIIRTSTADDTFTLACNGKLMASDVAIQATDVDSLTVTYGGNTIATGSGTVTKILNCDGRYMSGDVGVAVTMSSAPTPVEGAHIVFYSPNVFTISVNNATQNWDGTIEYSTDATNWSVWIGDSAISSSQSGGYKYLYLRGSGNTKISGNSISYRWVFTGSNISIAGKMSYLLNYNGTASPAKQAFEYLFSGYNTSNPNTALVDASGLTCDVMSYNCYEYLFQYCTSLVAAPKLPSSQVKGYAYHYMFYRCTALITPPTISATSCSTGSASDSYHFSQMFAYCTSLETPPSLSLSTVGTDACYQMFSNCTSLKTAPRLGALTLNDYCYDSMFQYCSSLTSLPSLPATSLKRSCYQYMFENCTSIKLSTSSSSTYPNTYRIPKSGTGTTAAYAMRDMFRGTGGSFKGTPTINTTYYTSNTVIS